MHDSGEAVKLKPWKELNAQKRREAMALLLYWGIIERRTGDPSDAPWMEYLHPDGGRLYRELPDWPNDDGLSFTEIWTPFLVERKNLYLGFGDHSIPWRYAVLKMSPELEMDYAHQGDTWAEAICKAAYEILGPERLKEFEDFLQAA